MTSPTEAATGLGSDDCDPAHSGGIPDAGGLLASPRLRPCCARDRSSGGRSLRRALVSASGVRRAHAVRPPARVPPGRRARCCWCPASSPGTPALPMSRALRREGFRTYRSDIRANVGCTLAAAAQLEERLEEIAQRRGSRVQIVGHSLGGMLARGVAARRPDLVSGIVTMGSPMLAPGAHHVSLARSVDLLVRLNRAGMRGPDGGGLRGRALRPGELRPGPGRSCRPTSTSPRSTAGATASSTGAPASTRSAAPVEVRSSHVGMAFDPQVIAAVVGGAAPAGRGVSCRSRSRRDRVASRAGARR